MLPHVALVRTDVSEEISASFIRVTRIDELGTMLAVTSNRQTLRRNNWQVSKICAILLEEVDSTATNDAPPLPGLLIRFIGAGRGLMPVFRWACPLESSGNVSEYLRSWNNTTPPANFTLISL
jgi:hypothetical protein